MTEAGGRREDAELLVRLGDQDPSALETLIDRHWSMVVAYLVRVTGSADIAEDVAQETFVRLWERRGRWEAAGSVRSLILRVARNEAVSRHRSDEARRRAASWSEPGRRRAPSPDEVLAGERLTQALDRAVSELPERRREVFVLRAMHEFPYKEIARIMGTSVQTVANQYSRALGDLRRRLSGLRDA